MASDGVASRRPPLPPPPKRRASGNQLPSVLLTYKRRRGATKSNSGSDPNTAQMSMVVARGSNSQQFAHQAPARHWISWRDTLEGFLRSPSVNQGPGGIHSCVCDALRCHGYEPLQQHAVPAPQGNLANGHGEAQESLGGLVRCQQNNNNGALVSFEEEANAFLEANKAMCSKALFDILVSENFAMLCHSLTATFHINKPDEVIGLANIDVRMRNGDYAHNPELFDQDINQIWEKFEQIGREMAGLATSLSVISRACYVKQVSGISEIDRTEHNTEGTSLVAVAHKSQRESTPTQLTPCDSGNSNIPLQKNIPKQTRTSGVDAAQVCKSCAKDAYSKGRVICDGCEGTYHVSCLNLELEDDSAKWYCPACTASGLVGIKSNNSGKTHENCNVCDWLDITKPKEDPELAAETQESAVANMEEDSEPDLSTTALSNLCKHCGTCEDEDKKFLVCGHPFCSYKFYHIRCLKESQIAKEKQKNRACWYCPSCLCRGCFKDRDDDYTVLCDGCDDAYHTYCMNPPRSSIPKGKWYCTSCCILRAGNGLQKYEKSIMQVVPGAKKAQGTVR